MRSLFANRYADALAKTILFFGAVHLIILAIEAVRVSVFVLNAFRILNLDLLIPGSGDGVASLVLSYGVVLLVYRCAYVFLTQPRGNVRRMNASREGSTILESRRAILGWRRAIPEWRRPIPEWRRAILGWRRAIPEWRRPIRVGRDVPGGASPAPVVSVE